MRYRRHTVAFGIAVLWLVPALAIGSFALDLQHEGIPTSQRAAYGAIALALALLAVRTAMIGVVARERDVVVRGVLRSRRVRWADVARFEWGVWRGWGTFPVGVLRRTDGSQIAIFALNPPFELIPGQDRRTDQLIEQLNVEVERHRDAGARAASRTHTEAEPPDAPPLWE